jgi:hypothetical protein
MKLSRTAGYAVRALVYLAGAEPGKPSASHAIAQAVGMTERFLPVRQADCHSLPPGTAVTSRSVSDDSPWPGIRRIA